MANVQGYHQHLRTTSEHNPCTSSTRPYSVFSVRPTGLRVYWFSLPGQLNLGRHLVWNALGSSHHAHRRPSPPERIRGTIEDCRLKSPPKKNTRVKSTNGNWSCSKTGLRESGLNPWGDSWSQGHKIGTHSLTRHGNRKRDDAVTQRGINQAKAKQRDHGQIQQTGPFLSEKIHTETDAEKAVQNEEG